jgi:DNA modification methylase
MGGVKDQDHTDRWSIWNGDCIDVMRELPDRSIHLSIYSPPFATREGGALFHYSSSERDLSNARTYQEFEQHYGFVVAEIARLTLPGRISAVHCMDVPTSNTGRGDGVFDFPGEIIRLHERHGFTYAGRRVIWKEPLAVRNRTMSKGLAHKTIVEDAAQSTVANADYLLAFRRAGNNPIPVTHPTGLTDYAGERQPLADLARYRGWTGKQTENRWSHWIWRQYASSVWDDIRIDRVLPYREARDDEDEKHLHPLQLDVIDRALVLWSNPGERVLTPFMGVGSEVYAAVAAGRLGVGIELKPSYYHQAVKNLQSIDEDRDGPQEASLFDGLNEQAAS